MFISKGQHFLQSLDSSAKYTRVYFSLLTIPPPHNLVLVHYYHNLSKKSDMILRDSILQFDSYHLQPIRAPQASPIFASLERWHSVVSGEQGQGNRI